MSIIMTVVIATLSLSLMGNNSFFVYWCGRAFSKTQYLLSSINKKSIENQILEYQKKENTKNFI
jgi:hypothetical protein